jgi:PadR family transcriptional regulator PadR
MDSQLKKGILELCILNQIAKNPTYGYPVLKQVITFFPDVSESTVYAILRRLAAAKYTEIYFGTESGGPERKYYRITKSGVCYLTANLRDWEQLCEAVSNMLMAT